MMVSATAFATCWIIITIVLALTDSDPSHSYQYGAVAVTFFFVFFASFGSGVLGVPWLYPTEINALEMRTKGASLALWSELKVLMKVKAMIVVVVDGVL
jgi:hypothetical protein